ncbi:MAG TPA: APC family permease [Acidimicrobiales bacterium]|nr:APC family permease [Acidimicrobiales bacterium]
MSTATPIATSNGAGTTTQPLPTAIMPIENKAQRTLGRRVGPFALTAFSVGSVIGAMWLVAGPLATRLAGAASLVSWAVAAFMLVFIALVYGELSATYPVSGGTARYSFLCFGPLAGFAAGWASWLQAVTIGPIETEIAISYLEPQWSGLVNSSGLLTEKGVGVAIAFMVFFTLLNLAGIRFLAGLNHLAVYWKIAVPLIAVAALAATSFHTTNFYSAGGFSPFGVEGILKAIPISGLVLALFGFEQAVQVGGEARQPREHLPTAVISSLLIAAVVYLLLQAAYIGALDPDRLTNAASWVNPLSGASGVAVAYGPFARLATSLGVGWVATLIYIDAVVSPAGKATLYVSSTSRITYSMSRTGTSPRVFERLDGRGTPWFSIVLAAVVGVVIFLPFSGWSRLIDFLAAATAFMYAFAPVSLAALRRSDPDRYRPYKVPAADVLAPVAFVFANLIIYWTGWPTVWRVSAGIAIGALLFLLAYLFTASAHRQPLKLRSAAWVLPWLIGIMVLDALGPAYVSGAHHVIPFWWDLGIVAVFSLAVFYLSQWLALPSGAVAANIAEAHMPTSEEDIDFGAGS